MKIVLGFTVAALLSLLVVATSSVLVLSATPAFAKSCSVEKCRSNCAGKGKNCMGKCGQCDKP